MLEEWKDIPGYEGLYQVSNTGKVKRDEILKPYNNGGYMYIKLSMRGKVKQFKIHRLVADAFVNTIEGKNVIHHKDNNPSNNLYTNLEWCTQADNIKYAKEQGRQNLEPMRVKGPKIRKIRTKLKYNKLTGMNFGSIKILKYIKQNKSAPIADVLCERCGSIKTNKDIRGELRGITRMCGSCKNKSKGRLLKFNNKRKDIVWSA